MKSAYLFTVISTLIAGVVPKIDGEKYALSYARRKGQQVPPVNATGATYPLPEGLFLTETTPPKTPSHSPTFMPTTSPVPISQIGSLESSPGTVATERAKQFKSKGATAFPTQAPTAFPTASPTQAPTAFPTQAPTTTKKCKCNKVNPDSSLSYVYGSRRCKCPG